MEIEQGIKQDDEGCDLLPEEITPREDVDTSHAADEDQGDAGKPVAEGQHEIWPHTLQEL